MNDTSKQAEQRAQQLLQELLRQAAATPELAEVLLRHMQEQLARFSAWCKALSKLPRAERRRRQRRLGTALGGVGVALALALSQAPPAQAASITVNGSCSLINAITAANTDSAVGGCSAGSGADTISLPGGTITLTSVNNTTATGNNGLPIITSTITIAGNGTTIARDGSAANFRIFQVESTGNLTLNDTTISGGDVLGSGAGGGIRNRGTLTLNNSTVSGNSANNGGGINNTGSGTLTLIASTVSGNSSSAAGGGIRNQGTATLTNSTVSDNISTTKFGGGGISNYGTLTLTGSTLSGNNARNGGGIINSNTLTLTNSTVSGNSGLNSGGIENEGTLTVTNSTVSGNSTYGSGGDILNFGTATLNRNLIVGNSASSGQEIRSFGGTVTSNNYNLFAHSGLTNAQAFVNFTPSGSDISATSDGSDPTTLASILNTTLQNNSGATQTHALVSGSPAVDAVSTGPTTDQRGLARPQGSAFDIGAFEQEQNCVGPASGQVSCWPAGGDADDVWDSNPGTLQNGATFASGLVGQAFSFDGSNDFVLVPDANNLDLTTDFTINAWIYQMQASGGQTLVGKGSSSSVSGYALTVSGGQVALGLHNGANCVAVDSQTLPLGQWNHVAVTFSSSTAKVYVNGQLRATQTCSFSSVSASTEPLNIGRETSGLGRYYNGLADQVQIHNRALTLTEIQALYAGMGN